MRGQQRFVAIEGPVSYIIGSHDTTDVSVTQHTTHREEPAMPFAHPDDAIHRRGLTRTEMHTFVNTSREFAMLFEVNGHTLKLSASDYIALAVGDRIRAVCESVPDCPMLVRDWHNQTRGIRFRDLPAPLASVATEISLSLILLVIGFGAVLLSGNGRDARTFTLIGCGLVAFAALCALSAYRGAARTARTHAELDRLA
jgi:hypothetical protein